MNTYYANDKYSAVLTSGYTVGQTTLYVSAVPNHVPTIVVAAKGTDNETVFEVTGKTTNSLTGVSRLRGANVDLDAQTPLTCLNNEEFINQLASVNAVFNEEHDETGKHTTDQINEKTEGAGVTVDGVLIKDGKVATTKAVSVQITDADTDVATGDGKAILNIPTLLDGYVLKRVAASVTTAPVGAAISIQINNVTDNVDMLSTRLTIDAGEKTSATAATPAVIDTSHDDVATNDVIRIDVDQVGSTTAGAGLVVRLEFETS